MRFVFHRSGNDRNAIFARYVFLSRVILRYIEPGIDLPTNYVEAYKKMVDLVVLRILQGALTRKQLIRWGRKVLSTEFKGKFSDRHIENLVLSYLDFTEFGWDKVFDDVMSGWDH